MTLRDLDRLINDIMDVLVEEEPQDGLEAALEQALDRASAERVDKIEAICSLVKYLEKWGQVRQEESKRIAALGQSDLKKSLWLKDYLMRSLESHGEKNVRTTSYNIAITANGGKQALELLVDAEKLPPEYQCIEYKPNNDELRKALQRGDDLGQIAKLVPKGQHLRIR